MKNLSELFRNKLGNTRHEGMQENWKQLEKRLNEAQSSKKAFWFRIYLFSGMAAVITIVSALLLKTENNSSDIVHNTPIQKINTLENANQADKPNNPASQNMVTDVETVDPVQIPDESDTESKINRNSTMNINTSAGPVTYQTKSNINQSNKIIESKHPSNQKVNKSNFSQAFTGTPLSDSETAFSQNRKTDENDINSPNTNHILNPNINGELASLMPFGTLTVLSEKKWPLEPSIDKAGLNSNSNRKPNQFKSDLKFALSVFGSAAWSNNIIKANDKAEESVVNRRKSEEKSVILPGAGVEIEIRKGHFLLKSGINIQQQGEVRTYSSNFVRDLVYDSLAMTINDLSYWQIDTSILSLVHYGMNTQNSDTLLIYYDPSSNSFYQNNIPAMIIQTQPEDTSMHYIIDSTFVAVFDTSIEKYSINRKVNFNDRLNPALSGRNYATYVEVPVLFGYKKAFGRLNWNVMTGISAGLLTKMHALYITKDGQQVQEVAFSQYKSVVLSHQLRTGVQFQISPSMSLDLSAFSRYNLNSVVKQELYFRQKYLNLGLMAGVTYKL